jgi:DNA ligase-1
VQLSSTLSPKQSSPAKVVKPSPSAKKEKTASPPRQSSAPTSTTSASEKPVAKLFSVKVAPAPASAPAPDASSAQQSDDAPMIASSAPAAPAKVASVTASGTISYPAPFDLSKRINIDKLLAHADWPQNGATPFLFLACAFDAIDKTKKRLEIVDILCNCFRTIIRRSNPLDLLPAVYLSIGRLAPAHEGIESGCGESIIMKALADATGRSAAHIKSEYERLGDLGLIAQTSKSNQRTMFATKSLTVAGVFATFKEIALESGNSSQDKKKTKIQSLLVASRGSEATFIARSMQGKLRIGLAEQSVIVALARAVLISPPHLTRDPAHPDDDALEEAAATLRRIYSSTPSYDLIIPALIKAPLSELHEHCKLTPGLPVKPMLAHPTKGVTEVLDRFSDKGQFTCEYKYDGERGQIHLLPDGSIRIFSRNSEDNTTKYPELVAEFKNYVTPAVKSCILDCEVVAFDDNKGIMSFQTLQSRGKKAVKIEDIKIKVCLFGFDLLYLNGESLLLLPLQERRRLLFESFTPVQNKFAFASSKDLSDPEDILAYLHEAVADKCEGLMVKTLEIDATYEPDKRCWKWLKVKKDYIQGLTDSFDLVPIGAYYGRGKRTGVYGAFLMACYDPENEEYQTITKIGTGFSDEDLKALHEQLHPNEVAQPPKYYRLPDLPSHAPDVYFRPVQVWEVQAADLSVSPKYLAACGLVDETKGIALRFPRCGFIPLTLIPCLRFKLCLFAGI